MRFRRGDGTLRIDPEDIPEGVFRGPAVGFAQMVEPLQPAQGARRRIDRQAAIALGAHGLRDEHFGQGTHFSGDSGPDIDRHRAFARARQKRQIRLPAAERALSRAPQTGSVEVQKPEISGQAVIAPSGERR